MTTASSPATSSPAGGSLRILLAEDHPVNQKVAQIMLTKSGHSVEVAADGAQAVEAAGRGGFDLVLMDMQMPVMDGLEATRRIRAQEGEQQRPRVTIIAMTANAREEDRQVCLDAGMDDFISKPIRMAALVEKLQSL